MSAQKTAVVVLTKCNRYSYRGVVYNQDQPTEVPEAEDAQHLLDTGYFRTYTGEAPAKRDEGPKVRRRAARGDRESLLVRRGTIAESAPASRLPAPAGTLEADTDGAVEVG